MTHIIFSTIVTVFLILCFINGWMKREWFFKSIQRGSYRSKGNKRMYRAITGVLALALVVGNIGIYAMPSRMKPGGAAAPSDLPTVAEGDGTDQEEASEQQEAPYHIELSDTQAESQYGKYRQYYSRVCSPMLKEDRAKVTGFTDAVAFPCWVDMSYFDQRDGYVRAGENTASLNQQQPSLDEQIQIWKAAWDKLPEAQKIENEIEYVTFLIINVPEYCDGWAQAFMQTDAKGQNKWLRKGYKRYGNYFKIDDSDPDIPVGVECALELTDGYTPTGTWRDIPYMRVTDEQFQYAARVAALFRSLISQGFGTETSYKNWCSPIYAVDPALLRMVEADYQEAKEALVLSSFTKEFEYDRFGVNMLDARPIIYKLYREEKTTEPDSPAPGSNPDPVDNPDEPKPEDEPEDTPNPTPDPGDPTPTTVSHKIFTRCVDQETGAVLSNYKERKTVQEGKEYTITTNESFEDYEAVKTSITDTMGKEDKYHDFLFKKKPTPVEDKYSAHIHCVSTNGTDLSGYDIRKSELKNGYSESVSAPSISGFKPNKSSVTIKIEGKNFYEEITYSPKDGEQAKDPAEDTAQNGDGDKGGGDDQPGDDDGNKQPPSNDKPEPTPPTDRPEEDKKKEEEDKDQEDKKENDTSDGNGGNTHNPDSPGTGNVPDGSQGSHDEDGKPTDGEEDNNIEVGEPE